MIKPKSFSCFVIFAYNMSRGFVKDGDQEEVPVVPPRAFLPRGVVNYVTTQGMKALIEEKDELTFERNSVTGNETDRRVSRNYLNAKLELLEERIRTAVVMDTRKQPGGIVGFGAYVSLKISHKKSLMNIRLTGADEADPGKGLISYFSPLASAIYGHREGEMVKVPLPAGAETVTIISVSYKPPKEKKPTAVSITNDAKVIPVNGNTTKDESTPDNISPGKKENPKDTQITSASMAKEDTQTSSKPVRDNANEVFPIVNERGITIGRAARWQCHDGSKLLHPVVHLHLFNSRGELYLQKRPEWKDIQPGKWDTAVGGHVGFGESIENALRRESEEELGITGFTPVFIKRYVFESSREKELVHSYKTIFDGPLSPSGELDGGRFWSREEILENMGKKVFTPNFESEYKKLFGNL